MATKKTAKQMQTKYRALQYSTFVGEFVAIITPFIIMGAVNADEWFKSDEGWKVGLGGALALALMGVAVFLVTRQKEDAKITNGFITLIVGWFLVAFIFLMLASIMEQITTIMFFGGLGLLAAFGLDIASKSFKEKALLYKTTIQKAKEKKLEEEVYSDLNDVKF